LTNIHRFAAATIAKQARGWQLGQPEPGTMVWVTPSGRSYATGPAAYPG
jgi:hypothetical protein